ncbi:LysR family transcriptional regulator [Micromonospora sp. NPDC023737]
MDFDLSQVRAFVVTAELRHFGKAAARLHLTQQALSKRVRRLEQQLGEALFVRDSRGVELTGAGARFLTHAMSLLTIAEAAAADTRAVSRPVRVDVWGHLHPPLRWMRRLSTTEPALAIEVSMRRSMGAAAEALLRGEIDVAFGRVHDLDRPLPAELRHQPVQLGRNGALMNAGHPFAGADALRPAELVETGMWLPAAGSPPELLGYYRRFATHFGIPMHTDGPNLGLEHVIEHLRAFPGLVMVVSMDLPIPADSGARMIPVTGPCARWPWAMVWRRQDRNPAVALLRRQLVALGNAEGWLAFDPRHDWLPEPDLADLRARGERRTPPATG